MKAFIENIQNFCVHDGEGIRTVVFFKGCPLSCLWCSNPTTQMFKQELLYYADKCFHCRHCMEICSEKAINYQNDTVMIDREKCNCCGKCVRECPGKALLLSGKIKSIDEVLEEIQKDLVFYRNSGGGVTLSGGEVLAQADFAVALLQSCVRYGIHLAIETSGFGKKEDLLKIGRIVDQIFFDVKHANNDIHYRLTGQGNTLIIDNLRALLDEQSEKVTIRLPLIPGLNDDEKHLYQYAGLINQLGKVKNLEILPYHRLGKNKYSLLGKEYSLKDVLPMSKKVLSEKGQLLKSLLSEVNVFLS